MPTLVLLCAAVLWGLTWVPLRLLNAQGVEGVPLTLVAYLAACVVYVPLLALRYHSWRSRAWQIATLLLMGGLLNVAYNVALMYGDVVRAMLLFYLQPVWGVLGGWLFLRERVDLRRMLAVPTGLAGAVLVLGGPALLANPPSPMDALAVLAGFAYAMANVTARAAREVPESSKVACHFIGAALMAGAVMPLQPHPVPPLDLPLVLALTGYSLGYVTLGTALTMWAVTRMEAGRAALLLSVELLVGVFSGALFAGGVLGLRELGGTALVLSAVLLETLPRRGAPAGNPA